MICYDIIVLSIPVMRNCSIKTAVLEQDLLENCQKIRIFRVEFSGHRD